MIAALLGAACSDSVGLGHSGARQVVQVGGGQLNVPDGFTVNLFAEGLDGVRSLALGAAGAVFATLSGSGEIVRLTDGDGDGVADSRSTILSGLDYPFGLGFRGDTMYFAEQTTVKRLDPGAAAPVTVIAGLPSDWHYTRTIAFGPDNRLYVAVGSSCDVCDEPPPRAAVTRYDLDGSNPHVFATGLRNSVGLAFHPTTGELWATNNDRENLGDDLPPDRVNILKDGRWYGWPQCYLPGRANPEYVDADCSGMEPPAVTFQAHSAPLGIAFYTGSMFPVEYRGDAFVTYHGSSSRGVPTGAKVVRVRVQDGRPAGIEDFVTGWLLEDGSFWGRPLGLLVMPDGALLVSDDWWGRIWRVSYVSGDPPPATGQLDVAAVTGGSAVDPDGYRVVLDQTTERPLGINEIIRIHDVPSGEHTVRLDGVAANCAVGGPNPRGVTVTAGATVSTAFSVSCGDGGTGMRLTGSGQFGTEAPAAGSAAQTFDLDITSDLAGRFVFMDWSVVRADGTVGKIVVEATDPSTRITAFRASSALPGCPTDNGVEIEGIGRVNSAGDTDPTGDEWVAFTVWACDNGPSESGNDVLRIEVPAFWYFGGGVLTSGDLIKS